MRDLEQWHKEHEHRSAMIRTIMSVVTTALSLLVVVRVYHLI